MPGRGKRKARKARRQAGKDEAARKNERVGYKKYQWFAGRIRDNDVRDASYRRVMDNFERSREPGNRIRREQIEAGNARTVERNFDVQYGRVQRVVTDGKVSGFRYGGRNFRTANEAKVARAQDRVKYYKRQ